VTSPANGIQAFGFSVPVLVGKNNTIIDGASSSRRREPSRRRNARLDRRQTEAIACR
jgi:hypothetical protein